jgi:hypothetical protein
VKLGSIRVLNRTTKAISRPGQRSRAKLYPAMEHESSVPAMTKTSIVIVFLKNVPNGSVVSASAKLPHCGLLGNNSGGRSNTDCGVLSALTTIQ